MVGDDPLPFAEPACIVILFLLQFRVVRFARTLNRDYDAVKNAIEMPWSNGQAEGQINRLKTLKRSMYGRAGPELLRARMLPFRHTD